MKALIRIVAIVVLGFTFLTVPVHAAGAGSQSEGPSDPMCPTPTGDQAQSSSSFLVPCTAGGFDSGASIAVATPSASQKSPLAAGDDDTQNLIGSTITVTGTDDDPTVGNLNGNGFCDLREAVAAANSNGAVGECAAGTGDDTIQFSIGGGGAQTINLDSQLDVTSPVLIDGTTQGTYSGTPLIRLHGSGTTLVALRFFTGSEGSTLTALMITGFSYAGVMIFSGDSSAHVTLLHNYIGTDGTNALGNEVGVLIFGGKYAEVGGPAAADRNIISGNHTNVELIGSSSGLGTSADHNSVRGNYIGLDATGSSVITGSAVGILFLSVLGNGASNNSILFNVIAGGNTADIQIQTAENDGNAIQGNLIGTNAAGTATLGDYVGVAIQAGDNNIVGGNTDIGKRNLISGMSESAIAVTGGTGTIIAENVLGMNFAGTSSLPNAGKGIYANNTDLQIARNWIAGSGLGVWLESSVTLNAGSENNCLAGNSPGFKNDTGSLATFEQNWWGAASGPSGAGSGSGDSVSTDVDFTPWATTPQPICAPAAYIGIASLDFGNQLAGTSAILPVTVLNRGPAPLHLSSLGAPGLPFLVIPGSSTCSTATPLAFGTTCDIAVQFTPTTTGASARSLILLSDSNPVPAALPLTGTGIGTQLLANPSFELDGNSDQEPDNWDFTNFSAGTDSRECYGAITYIYGKCALKLVGNGALKTASQTVLTSGGSGDAFSFALHNGTASVPGGATVRLTAELFNGVTLLETQTLDFSTGTHGFERLGGGFTAPSAYDKVVFTITLQAASGTAWFDVASLYKMP